VDPGRERLQLLAQGPGGGCHRGLQQEHQVCQAGMGVGGMLSLTNQGAQTERLTRIPCSHSSKKYRCLRMMMHCTFCIRHGHAAGKVHQTHRIGKPRFSSHYVEVSHSMLFLRRLAMLFMLSGNLPQQLTDYLEVPCESRQLLCVGGHHDNNRHAAPCMHL
jgi:hypothetical protein